MSEPTAHPEEPRGGVSGKLVVWLILLVALGLAGVIEFMREHRWQEPESKVIIGPGATTHGASSRN